MIFRLRNWASLILASIMFIKIYRHNNKNVNRLLLLYFNVILIVLALVAIFIDIDTEVIDYANFIK